MAAGDEVMTAEDMNPQTTEQDPQLGRWSTGAPTDADVVAGQQGAGGASKCEAPAG